MKSIIFTLCFIALTITQKAQAQVWQLQDPKFPYKTTPYDVFCPNSTDAWTIGWELDSAAVLLTEVNYTLSRTTDGGQSWENITFPHGEPGYFSSLSALNGDTAWIAYVDYATGNQLIKTIDGGQNWTLQPVVVNSWINTGHFFNDVIGVTLGDPDSLGFEIYTTNDGGDTWERVDNNTIPAPMTDEVGFSGFYEVVGTEIWFETSIGRVFHSPDYGHTWSVFDGPLPMAQSLVAVDNEKTVYMAYTAANADGSSPVTSLHRTSDNGISWEDITPLDNGWWIVDIEPVPGTNTIIASLNAGFTTGLFETRISYDRGSTWHTIDNTSLILYLDFADAQSGFAGKWRFAGDLSSSLVYNYTGSPLTSLLRNTTLLNLDVNISPNPTTDNVTIALTSEVDEDYWILLNDINGKLIEKKSYTNVSEFSHTMDVRALPAGSYSLTIANKHGLRTEKLMKL